MMIFNVKALYTYKFISQCLPIYAFYTMLFIERGQAVTDIAVLMAIWSTCTIVFEIPSGILADRWNRRNMLAVATVLQGLCFVVWFFSHSFLLFAIGFVFWAIAGAFTSGTEESLIYDNLKSDECDESFAQVYGKAKFYANVGNIAGIVSAGIVASFISIETITLISAAICFVNVVFVLQIREKNLYLERVDEEPTGFLETLKEASAFIKGSKTALFCILFLVFFASIGDYLDEFDAFIINDFELTYIWVSVILMIRFIFGALGDLFAPMIQRKISSIKQIFLLSGLSCIFLAIFSLIWSQYVILVFGFSSMVMTIAEILLVNALQNEIKDEGRATVISFYGAGQNVVMICFSLFYALLAGIFTLQQVYLIISIYGIVGGIGFYLFLNIVRDRA